MILLTLHNISNAKRRNLHNSNHSHYDFTMESFQNIANHQPYTLSNYDHHFNNSQGVESYLYSCYNAL